jgi:hypothetical protein
VEKGRPSSSTFGRGISTASESEVVVIDTGYAGIMRGPRETIDRISAQGIEVKVEWTSEAVEMYINLQGVGAAIAISHAE